MSVVALPPWTAIGDVSATTWNCCPSALSFDKGAKLQAAGALNLPAVINGADLY